MSSYTTSSSASFRTNSRHIARQRNAERDPVSIEEMPTDSSATRQRLLCGNDRLRSSMPSVRGALYAIPEPPTPEVQRKSIYKARYAKRTTTSIISTQALTTFGHLIISGTTKALRAGLITPEIAAKRVGLWAGTYILQRLCQASTNISSERWSQAASDERVALRVSQFAGRTDIWSDVRRRAQVEELVGSHEESAVSSSVHLTVSIASTLTQVLFNTGSVMAVLHPLIGSAVGLSSVLVAARLIWRMRHPLVDNDVTLRHRAELQHLNRNAVDTILLPHHAALTSWQQQRDNTLQAIRNAEAEKSFQRVRDDLIITGVTLTPTTACLMWNAIKGTEEALETLENMPQIIEVFGFFLNAAHFCAQADSLRQNLAYLETLASMDRPPGLEARMVRLRENSDEIELKKNGVRLGTLREIENRPELLEEPGRWTVTAGNGRGKSTFAVAVVAHFLGQRRMHYLPAAPKPLHSTSAALSDGEQKWEHLDAIDAQVQENALDIIILDEARAHLDADRLTELDLMVARWATTACIIECVVQD